MDLPETRILAVVARKSGENPDRRRGKGFSAMFVSRELVDPNLNRNPDLGKGELVNIPVLQM